MDKKLTPFLKWAGGKRWLAPTVVPLVGSSDSVYIEPFLGGGAMFFAHLPKQAMLSDVNDDLIRVYAAIRNDVEQVICRLSSMIISRDEFIRLRCLQPIDLIDHAVRFIYLNKTAFNGLYRVNQNGHFNVPFGCKPGTQLCDADLLRQCSESLQGINLRSRDFRDSLQYAGMNDTVFVDPPYAIKRNGDNFRRYNHRVFSWTDQLDLACICNQMVRDGAKVVITNAYHEDVLRLYDPGLFEFWSASRMSRMAANSRRRGQTQELLLISRTIKKKPRSSPSVQISPCHLDV